MGWEDELLAETPRGVAGREDHSPSAQWADPRALGKTWAYDRRSIFLGYRNGRAVGCSDDRHLLLVAGSRSGKGVSFVIPNLLLYEGSVLAIDPKGELAEVTCARRDKLGQKTYVIDPFNASGESTRAWRAGFNPLLEIDPESSSAIDDAALIADALIVDDGTGEKHWIYAARELVKGLILDALLLPKEDRHLGFVRSFFHAKGTRGPKGKPITGQTMRLLAMQARPKAFYGVLAGVASSLLAKNDRERNSIISAADVQLGFLDFQPLKECLMHSSFSLPRLKREKATVYLCLPAGMMATHAKWLRMIVSLAVIMCERVEEKPDPPLLLLLEEFAVLGHMRSVEAAAGQIAGFGVKICTVLQDLSQLKRHYKESWETFIGNAGAAVFFGNADVTTLEYVSKKLGTVGFDRKRLSDAGPSARAGGARVIEEQYQQARLLEPHEVERMFARERGRALVLYPGHAPLAVQRATYFKDDAFAGMFNEPVTR